MSRLIFPGDNPTPRYFWLKANPDIYHFVNKYGCYGIHDMPSEWAPGDRAFLARTVKYLVKNEKQVTHSTTIENIRVPTQEELEHIWKREDSRWNYVMDLTERVRVRKPFSMDDMLNKEALNYYHPRPTWALMRPQDVKLILEFQGVKIPRHIQNQTSEAEALIPVQYTDEGLLALFFELKHEMGNFVLEKWNSGSVGPDWMQEGNTDHAYKRILAKIRSDHRSKFPRMPRDHRDLVEQVKLCTSTDMPLRAHAQIALVRIAAVQSGFMTEDDARWLWHHQK